MTINRNELKYLVFSAIFAAVVFGYIFPKVLSNGILETLTPFQQFLLFNLSIFLFLQIFLKAVTLNNGFKMRNVLGVLGIIFLFIAMDNVTPPLLFSPQGTLVENVPLGQSASDYLFGTFALSLGLNGFIAWIFVYVVMTFVLLIASAKLLPNFIRHI